MVAACHCNQLGGGGEQGSQSAATSISKETKCKSHLLHIMEDHYEKVTAGIGALVQTVLDSNIISDRQQISI
ncbi:hypothetical protein VNO77_07138 [Canavalia gladiata]|uniref:Uncharacterized protein n=1 Tax=Canavalia gladiata TaxID=3824 RepID=A0AAN9QT95_CANGL